MRKDRIGYGIILFAAAMLACGTARAVSISTGSTTTVTTCAPDTTVTTATPYTVCTPYTVTTDLGYNTCAVGGDKQSSSGDFAMNGSCSTATETTTAQACTVAYNYTTSVVPGVCTTTTVSTDGCTTGGHNCNHGGGPGG